MLIGPPDQVDRGRARQPFTHVKLDVDAARHEHVGLPDYVGRGSARQPFTYVKLNANAAAHKHVG